MGSVQKIEFRLHKSIVYVQIRICQRKVFGILKKNYGSIIPSKGTDIVSVKKKNRNYKLVGLEILTDQ